jgi:CheY-like chemotaxis protein
LGTVNEAGREADERPAQILVVDDDDELRMLVCELLIDHGYTAAGASDGREALEHLRNHPPPDLILLDLWMPVMSGTELLEERKRLGVASATHVFVLTAHIGVEDSAEALGVDRVFLKPAKAERLLKAIGEVVAR